MVNVIVHKPNDISYINILNVDEFQAKRIISMPVLYTLLILRDHDAIKKDGVIYIDESYFNFPPSVIHNIQQTLLYCGIRLRLYNKENTDIIGETVNIIPDSQFNELLCRLYPVEWGKIENCNFIPKEIKLSVNTIAYEKAKRDFIG